MDPCHQICDYLQTLQCTVLSSIKGKIDYLPSSSGTEAARRLCDGSNHNEIRDKAWTDIKPEQA